jgi:hypothetical protein
MGERFVAAEEFGVELGEFFQAGPELLIGGDALLAGLLLGRGFEQKLQDVARREAAGQVVKGAVLLALGTRAVGLATGGEPFDVGSAQELRRHGEAAQERGLALAQGQGGGAAELVYLSQLLGEDNRTGAVGKQKENAPRPNRNANLPNPLRTKTESTVVKKVCEIDV